MAATLDPGQRANARCKGCVPDQRLQSITDVPERHTDTSQCHRELRADQAPGTVYEVEATTELDARARAAERFAKELTKHKLPVPAANPRAARRLIYHLFAPLTEAV